MKALVLLASQVWPGVTPWTGVWAGAVAQATRRAGAANRAALRIDGLLSGNAAHLELAVDDCKAEPSLDKIERVLAEFFEPPAIEDTETRSDAGRKGFEVVGARNETGRDARFLGPDFQEQLEQVADEHTVLGKAGPLGRAVGEVRALERLGCSEGRHQPVTEVIVLPYRRQASNASQVILIFGRVENDFVERVILHDAPAREVLGTRFRFAPSRERL